MWAELLAPYPDGALRASAQLRTVPSFCSDKLKRMFTGSSPPCLQELMMAPSCWLASDTKHKRGKNLKPLRFWGCLLHSTLPAYWVITDGDQKYQQVQQMCLEWSLGGWWGPSLQQLMTGRAWGRRGFLVWWTLSLRGLYPIGQNHQQINEWRNQEQRDCLGAGG